jgi:hypothetical protein
LERKLIFIYSELQKVGVPKIFFTLDGLRAEGLTGHAWKFNKDTLIEAGLKLIDDEKPEHYTLAPTRNMPLDEYKGLLEIMGLKCSKYLKIKKDGSMEVAA